MKALVMLSVALAMAGSVSHAEGRVPLHADYPAAIYTGPPAPVQLDTDFKRSMRTRLRNGAQAQPDFAGSYHVVTWGCGTNCLNGVVVNRRTGKVYGLPEEPADLQLFDLWHRANSRLLVATNRAYNPSDCTRTPRWFFYVFDRGKFTLVKTVERPDKRWAMPVSITTPERQRQLVNVNSDWCSELRARHRTEDVGDRFP